MDTETAWAAGLYEGEGHTGVYSGGGNSKGVPRISLSMTDKDVVDRFHRWAGVGTVRPEKTSKNYKQLWRFYVGKPS